MSVVVTRAAKGDRLHQGIPAALGDRDEVVHFEPIIAGAAADAAPSVTP